MGERLAVSSEPWTFDLPCWECRRPLSILPDCSPLLFRCPDSHYSTIENLLGKWLPEKVSQPTGVLAQWEDRSRSLLSLARQALLGKSFFDVEALATAAEALEDRICALRSLGSRAAVVSRDRSA